MFNILGVGHCSPFSGEPMVSPFPPGVQVWWCHIFMFVQRDIVCVYLYPYYYYFFFVIYIYVSITKTFFYIIQTRVTFIYTIFMDILLHKFQRLFLFYLFKYCAHSSFTILKVTTFFFEVFTYLSAH